MFEQILSVYTIKKSPNASVVSVYLCLCVCVYFFNYRIMLAAYVFDKFRFFVQKINNVFN